MQQYLREGMTHAASVNAAWKYVDALIDAAVAAVGDTRLQWPVEMSMYERGLPIRRWYDTHTRHYCFYDDSSDEIEILYFCHERQNYQNMLYRLMSLYTYVPYLLPGEEV